MSGLRASTASVDDYLGPGDKRFFSAGYRRVRYRFDDITAAGTDRTTGELSARVGLGYPADWSRKSAKGTLRPHLSTIDAILLAVQLGDLYLTHAYRLDERERRALWVRKLRIRAGAAPDEDLDDLTVGTKVASAAGDVVVMASRIGGMRTRCEIVGLARDVDDDAAVVGDSAVYPTEHELLGPADERYYGTGFTRRAHRLRDLALDQHAATAAVDFEGDDAGRAGIEGDRQPAVTMVDCFATSLQLAQVLLYQADAMDRGDSNTLWMRSTDLTVDDHTPLAAGMPLHTSVTDLDLISMNGASWRTATVHGRLGGVTLRCGVTHALPGRVPPAIEDQVITS